MKSILFCEMCGKLIKRKIIETKINNKKESKVLCDKCKKLRGKAYI